jgi:hypothetical protein
MTSDSRIISVVEWNRLYPVGTKVTVCEEPIGATTSRAIMGSIAKVKVGRNWVPLTKLQPAPAN